VHSGGEAVVGMVGAEGGRVARNLSINAMQSKSPMHLMLRWFFGLWVSGVRPFEHNALHRNQRLPLQRWCRAPPQWPYFVCVVSGFLHACGHAEKAPAAFGSRV
jgi:hypothetical protein